MSLCCEQLGAFSCRFIFLTFNTILLMCGSVVFILGCWLQASMYGLHNREMLMKAPLPTATLLFGVLLIVLSISGYFCLRNPSFLFMYGLCLAAVFLLEIYIGIMISFSTHDVHTSLKYFLRYSMERYSDEPKYERMVDSIQANFECCGVDSPDDWLKFPIRKIPQSCCRNGFCSGKKEDIFRNGCSERLFVAITGQKKTIGIVLLTMALIPMVGTAIATCLSKKMSKRN